MGSVLCCLLDLSAFFLLAGHSPVCLPVQENILPGMPAVLHVPECHYSTHSLGAVSATRCFVWIYSGRLRLLVVHLLSLISMSECVRTNRRGGLGSHLPGLTPCFQKQKSAWRLKNNGYDPQKGQINTLDRRTQTTIFRLRTGHCGLREHLKRLGLADSAHCEYGSEEQTPEHILQTCPHLETVRQQFWPEDTEVGTKLWGQAAELQRTADFLAATGLRI